MPQLCPVICGLFLIIVNPSTDDTNDLRGRLLREAPQKWAEYDRRAVLLKATGRVLYEQGTITNIYTANESCRMVLQKRLDAQESTVFAVNSDYAFQLRRISDNDPWNLVKVELNKQAGEVPALARMVARDTNWPHSRLVYLSAETLADIISRPEFTVISLAPETNSAGLVRLQFQCPHPLTDRTKIYAVQGGIVVLDPARYWCLREGRVQLQSSGRTVTQSFRITLDESSDIPLPLRYQSTEEWIAQDGASSTQTSETETAFDATAKVPDPIAFRLPAFGLPEPLGLSSERPSRRKWLWSLTCSGVALIVLGVLYARWKRRAQGNRHL